MLLSRGARQQRVLRAVKPIWTRSLETKTSSRLETGHNVPRLTHGVQYAKEGVPDVLSPEAFHMAWTDYQGYLCEKLNQLTAHSEDAGALTKTLTIKYARDPSRASLFNHASMAHNNHIFFEAMAPDPSPPSQSMQRQITQAFSSFESLRSTMIATALSMFGPGFVWLVALNSPQVSSPSLALLTTYIAGSPYPGAHFRQQPLDMATTGTNVGVNQTPQAYALNNPTSTNQLLRGYAGSMGASSMHNKPLAPGGQDLEVLLGVNMWEHVWLRDYGFAGKRQFLEKWWDKVDWAVVEGNMEQTPKGRMPFKPFGR